MSASNDGHQDYIESDINHGKSNGSCSDENTDCEILSGETDNMKKPNSDTVAIDHLTTNSNSNDEADVVINTNSNSNDEINDAIHPNIAANDNELHTVVEEDKQAYKFGVATPICDLYGNASGPQVLEKYSNQAEFYFKVDFVFNRGEHTETSVSFESAQYLKGGDEDFIMLVACLIVSTGNSSIICVPAKWFNNIKEDLNDNGIQL